MWWKGRQHLRLGLGELERADQPGAPDAVHAPRQAVVDDTQGSGAKGRRASDEREAARQLHAGLVRGERDGGLVEGAHEDGDEEGSEGEAQHEGGPATIREAACNSV